MRQIATILLLAILIFNWVGYRFFAAYMEHRSDVRLEAELDNNNYDESTLISIKVPLTHLAYYNASQNFERTDGQIDVNGVVYKYVKRRIFNDSLEVLCIPNKTATLLNTAKDEFFRLVNDLQAAGQNSKTNSQKNSSKVFSTDNYIVSDILMLSELGIPVFKSLIPYTENLSAAFLFTEEQPPDFIS